MLSAGIFNNLRSAKKYTLIGVAGRLGHSISILLITYAHFIPTMQELAAQPAGKSAPLVPRSQE
jgi:hypothetical protein